MTAQGEAWSWGLGDPVNVGEVKAVCGEVTAHYRLSVPLNRAGDKLERTAETLGYYPTFVDLEVDEEPAGSYMSYELRDIADLLIRAADAADAADFHQGARGGNEALKRYAAGQAALALLTGDRRDEAIRAVEMETGYIGETAARRAHYILDALVALAKEQKS